MKQRILTCILCLLLLGWVRAAAAQGPQEQTIVFWNNLVWGLPGKAIDALVEDFNKENKGKWHVEQLNVADMEQKILTATAGRVPPDVAIFDRFRIAAFADRGAFRDVSDLEAQADFRPQRFFESCYKECVYQGKTYGVAFNSGNRMLFYNCEHFRQAELDPDRPPRTWKELEEFARRLTQRDAKGRITRLGFAPIYGNAGMFMYGFLSGGHFMNEDNTKVTLTDPKLVRALQWMTDFCAEYGMDELDRFSTGFGSDAFYPFVAGKFSMDCQEGFLVSLLKQFNPGLEYRTAPMPWPEDGERASWNGGFAFVFPVGSKNQAGAVEFVRYMTSKRAQIKNGKICDQVPAVIEAANDPYFMENPVFRGFINEMPYTRIRPVSVISSMMYDELFRSVDFAVHKKATPLEVLTQSNKLLQDELDRFNKKKRYPQISLGRWLAVTTLLALLLVGGRLGWSLRRIWASRLMRERMLKGYLFALPSILGMLVFVLIPMLASVIFSFTHYEILTQARWLGFENFRRLFTDDPFFWKSLWNTLVFTVLSVPFGMVMSVFLALLLNREFKLRSLFRTMFFIPSIVPLVAASILWMWLYNGEYGIINDLLGRVELPPVHWLTNELWAKPALVLMGIWGVGGGMIIALAGLQGIPRSMYEAAQIDGASPAQQLVHVTLPMLSPTLFFMLIMGVIGSFQVFTQAYIMTGGGPRDSTLFYVFYLFNQGFRYFNMGYASAMAWVLLVIVALLSFIQFKFANKWVHYER